MLLSNLMKGASTKSLDAKSEILIKESAKKMARKIRQMNIDEEMAFLRNMKCGNSSIKTYGKKVRQKKCEILFYSLGCDVLGFRNFESSKQLEHEPIASASKIAVG